MGRPAIHTFLFSDLRDYTAFIETKGDQDATRMLRASRRIVRAAVAKHRGAEIKTEGDSFYVVFRSPSSALKCAVEIQRAAAAHNERHPDVPVRMGIGINTGEAVPHDKGYVGSAVVIAGRLSTSCKAGQIVVTDTVRALVRTGAHAAMRELGPWTLKGVAEPVRVYEVGTETTSAARALRPALPLPAILAAAAQPTPGLVVCPDLVQRDRELATLRAHLEAAARGEVRIVSVSGEGGIGKSRLVREAAAIAHGEGMYVFGGRAHRSGPPYEPFIVALRPYARARGTEILSRHLGALMPELRRLLPEVEVAGAGGPEIPAEERRDRFMRTISLLLEDAAAQRPVLLVLEDFHEADEVSRDTLRYLASAFRAALCLVLVHRADDAGAAHPLGALLADLERDRMLARIALTPLDAAGVEQMTRCMVPGADRHALVRAVYERSQGIPFYVEELLKTALDEPLVPPDEALPRTISDSVQLRVSRLVAERGPHIADLLEALAIAEVPLGYDTVLRLAGRDEAAAGADLAAAIAAQLLEQASTRSEIYRYRHALTREAIAAGIAPARRRELHARVAHAIEAENDPLARASLLARHYAAAGDRPRAVSHMRRAAANAVQLGAYTGAVELLGSAAPLAKGAEDEGAVLRELAEALEAAGRPREAEDALLRARATTSAPGELARIDIHLTSVLRMQGRRTEAKTVIQRAVTALRAEAGPDLATALAAEAELAWAEHDLEETMTLARSALDIARQNDARVVEIKALQLLGGARNRLGQDDGIGLIEESVAAAKSARLVREEVEASLELARAFLWRARNDEALEVARRGIVLARESGLEFLEARLLANATTIAVNLGRYAEARSFAERGVAIARPDTIAPTQALMALAHVISDQGEGEAALEIYERIRSEAERSEPERRPIFWSYRAQALLGLGRLEEAAEAARVAVQLTLENPGQGMTAFLNAAEICEARGDRAGIIDLAAKFDRYFEGPDTPAMRIARLEIAAVRRSLEGKDAARDFAAVADLYQQLDARVRTAYRRGTAAILATRDPSSAAAAVRDLERSRGQLLSFGALRYVRALDAMVQRVAGTPWVVAAADPVVRAN